MAIEPITLFSRIADLAGVARRLRELAPAVQIDGPDDNWRKAVVTFGKRMKKRTLTLIHDPAYYSEPNWSGQMSGMRGYFGRFPDTARKPQVMMLTTSFHFSLGTLFDPDFGPEGDPRLDILFAVTELLDGVLFTASSLRDARGRILFGADGADDEDPEAVWPRVVGEVSNSEPLGAAMHERSRRKPFGEVDADADPPMAARVARRAVALTCVTARAVLEQDTADPGAGGTHDRLLAWAEDLGIKDELVQDEWEVLQRPPGGLDRRMQINSTWRLEGLAVLAWALGRFELPPHDQIVSMGPLWRSLELWDASATGALLAGAALRPREEIWALRDRLFALHWRLRDFHHSRRVMDFAEFARTCEFGPLDITGLPLVEGDLGLQGARIDRAPPDVFSSAHSAALERHQAVNWLWEGPRQYSEASRST
jgi:hypothetical protein